MLRRYYTYLSSCGPAHEIEPAAFHAEVLVRAWVDGDLDRTYPGGDPCGLVGYAGRMAIVTLMSLGTFGVLGAIAGWLGEQAARRIIRVRSQRRD